MSKSLIDSISAVVIEEHKAEGFSYQEFDRIDLQKYSSRSLADLLSNESSLFIKQYGLGLATASSRGGGAAHTALLWEGINLASPLLGQTDLAIIPVVFIDHLSWQAGGSSALTGNAAIGGSIQLESRQAYHTGWTGTAQLALSSLQKIQPQLKLAYAQKYYALSFGIAYNNAKNNYLYRDVNAFGNPKPLIRLAHALQESVGIFHMQQFQWRKHHFNLKSWYQDNYKQIPPTLLQTTGDAEEQWDKSWRNVLSWKKVGTKRLYTLKAAWIWNLLHYKSNVVDSKSRTQQILIRWKDSWFSTHKTGAHQFSYVLEGEQQAAQSSNFREPPQQWLAAIQLQYRWSFQPLILNVNFREQWMPEGWLRPAASLNTTVLLLDREKTSLNLRASTSHNYRYPTFNDRYWPNAGNPNLKAEYSWSQDLSLIFHKKRNKGWNFLVESTGFSNWVNNWILWTPEAGIWRPSNVAKVWARGLEQGLSISYHWYKHQLKSRMQYNFNLAVRQDPPFLGKQLIYTPSQQTRLELQYQWHGLSFSYQHYFVGIRYLDNANQNFLTPYQVGNIHLSYPIHFKNSKLFIQFLLNNLWATDYQVVANRPMPRRNFELILAIDF